MVAVQRELKPLALGDVRWTNAEQLHLTLKFLGNFPASSVEAVKHTLKGVCVGVRPFALQASGVGFFPNAHSPRVIWVGFEDGQNALADLQKRVATLLDPFVQKPGEEKFLAHATLGRFQKYRQYKCEKLLPRATELRDHVFGEWRVEDVGLFRSELSPDGARHTRLADFPFGASLVG